MKDDQTSILQETIGMGTWHMGDEPVKEQAEIEALKAGIDGGLIVIDTAEM